MWFNAETLKTSQKKEQTEPYIMVRYLITDIQACGNN